MTPNEEELERHLSSGRFQAGVAKKRWKLLSKTWPNLFIGITARDGSVVALNFDCTDYPHRPPTARPWDFATNSALPPPRWPKGGRVSQVFNPGWKGGTALYIPCDRQSIEGHPNWLTEYPWLIWDPARGLTQYIEAVYETLQSNELICPAT